jgi:hypothetical protein
VKIIIQQENQSGFYKKINNEKYWIEIKSGEPNEIILTKVLYNKILWTAFLRT